MFSFEICHMLLMTLVYLTGKTIIARLLATILNKLGIISEAKVVEVQRTDLIAQYVGWTGPKTRKKVQYLITFLLLPSAWI